MWASITAIALLGTLLAAFAAGAHAKVESFQSLAPSPVELAGVATDPGTGLVYAQENGSTSFFRYDPRTNAWSGLAPSPIDRFNNAGATYLGGKIYVTYAEGGLELGVYDIATNSWATLDSPLNESTGNITSAGGKLYLAVEHEFVAYDPATGIVTPLAEPPEFTGTCEGHGFEQWGGLQVADGKIYAHQGNGCTGFAVYDLAANSWQELPPVPAVVGEERPEPRGPVLGSAIDPITNTYLAYGTYLGKDLFRYDIEAGSWSTVKLPFTVNDGGMAYVSLPGFEGVYMVQGEEKTGFARYTERNLTDLAPTMSAAAGRDGMVTYSVQVKNNGPERAGGVVLSDSLPAGTTLISAATSQGTCAATAVLTCNLGLLRSGASASLTIQVKSRSKEATNIATVSSQATDSNAGNDRATATSTQCVIPKIRSRKLKAAKKALRTANCKPGKLSRRFSGKVKAGKVIRTAKARGTLLPAGSKVKLVVSRGPKGAR